MMDNGHWTYHTQLTPSLHFGFVYQITCTMTGRSYIGKKQYHSYRKGRVVQEMDWRNYTGSSKGLNTDIKKLGKSKFTFTVLKEYKTRGWLSYGECNTQHKLDTLTKRLPDGSRAFYNRQILAIKFVPSIKQHPELCK
jgi:hypothetical protein